MVNLGFKLEGYLNLDIDLWGTFRLYYISQWRMWNNLDANLRDYFKLLSFIMINVGIFSKNRIDQMTHFIIDYF